MGEYTREKWDEIKALGPKPGKMILENPQGPNRVQRRSNHWYQGFSGNGSGRSVRPSGTAPSRRDRLEAEKAAESLSGS